MSEATIGNRPRIGIDLGGTKIEGLALGEGDRVLAGPIRIPTPRNDYDATLAAIEQIVRDLEAAMGMAGGTASIGIGMPGSIARQSGLVQNANSVWLNGRPLQQDIDARLARPVRLANDANCFALSEAQDGAAVGAHSMFGVILGTGCGGGLVINGKLIGGALGMAGEWGHNPLPWPTPDEHPGPHCWCGRRGCMETWVSGPAIERQYVEATKEKRTVEEIAAAAHAGDGTAADIMRQHTDRLARGLSHVVNIFDPDVIVLGGGLSNLKHLYQELPIAMQRHLFTDAPHVEIRPARWGDSSGVRGAARLW